MYATSAGLSATGAGRPIAARIRKLLGLRSKEVSYPDTPYLPCERAKTVISRFCLSKCVLTFVLLLILPESSSVVISRGLAALVKAGDRLDVTQDIV